MLKGSRNSIDSVTTLYAAAYVLYVNTASLTTSCARVSVGDHVSTSGSLNFSVVVADTAGADDQYYYSMEELAAKFEQHYCCTDVVRNKPDLCLDSKRKLTLLSSDSGNSSS